MDTQLSLFNEQNWDEPDDKNYLDDAEDIFEDHAPTSEVVLKSLHALTEKDPNQEASEIDLKNIKNIFYYFEKRGPSEE